MKNSVAVTLRNGKKRKAYHLYIYTNGSGKIRKNDNTEEGNGEELKEKQSSSSSRGSRQPRKKG